MDLEQVGKNNCKKLLGLLGGVTLPLVAMDHGTEWPVRRASGFLAQRKGKTYLLTAAHAIGTGQWFIEAKVDAGDNGVGILIPLSDVWATVGTFSIATPENQEVDFAWAEIDIRRLREQAKADERMKYRQFDLPCYSGPLDRTPSQADVFSYIAYNRAEEHEGPLGSVLLREPSFECGMLFERRTTMMGKDVYCFKLAGTHKGHPYYEGSSGAPIADAGGIIVSMVLGGDSDRDELWGLPLADYEHLVGDIG